MGVRRGRSKTRKINWKFIKGLPCHSGKWGPSSSVAVFSSVFWCLCAPDKGSAVNSFRPLFLQVNPFEILLLYIISFSREAVPKIAAPQKGLQQNPVKQDETIKATNYSVVNNKTLKNTYGKHTIV